MQNERQINISKCGKNQAQQNCRIGLSLLEFASKRKLLYKRFTEISIPPKNETVQCAAMAITIDAFTTIHLHSQEVWSLADKLRNQSRKPNHAGKALLNRKGGNSQLIYQE
jgi:hypothetical protein